MILIFLKTVFVYKFQVIDSTLIHKKEKFSKPTRIFFILRKKVFVVFLQNKSQIKTALNFS